MADRGRRDDVRCRLVDGSVGTIPARWSGSAAGVGRGGRRWGSSRRRRRGCCSASGSRRCGRGVRGGREPLGKRALRRVVGEVHRGSVDRDAGAAEVDERDQRVGGVEAEGAVADQADLAVEAFEAAVGEAEADGGEDAVAVRAQGAREADERPQPGADGPGQPGVEVRGRERGVGRGGRAAAVLRAAGRRGRGAGWPGWTSASVASWRTVWCSGALSSDQRVLLTQRPCGVWERSWAFHSSRRTWSVGARAEPDDVEGVKADLGVGDGGADRALVLAAHVDRDRPDRALGGRRARRRSACRVALLRPGAHHTIAPVRVVGDRGQVAVMAAVADLVDADADQALEAALVEVVGDDARDDRADRAPADPQQPRDRREGHLLRQPRDRRPRSRACACAPGRAHGTGSSRTPQSRQRSSRSSHSIQQRLAPRSRCRQRLTRRSWISQLAAGLAAARADPPAAPQPDGHDHARRR